MRVLVVIPAHNEAENIASVVSEVRAMHPELDLVVVDDGSSDSTAVLARSLGAKVIALPFNLGYGAAVQTGFLYAVEAGYDACVLIDGDGQMDPRYISALIDQVANNQVDLALGSRFLWKADNTLSIGRRLGIYLFGKVVSFFTHQQITDPTSGFQAIGRRLMQFFVNDNYPTDFPDADAILRLYFAGFKLKEVPVTMRPRLRGESMHRGASIIYYLYKMLFSILIALTQRKILAKGVDHANNDEGADRLGEPAGDVDDCKPRASETAG